MKDDDGGGGGGDDDDNDKGIGLSSSYVGSPYLTLVFHDKPIRLSLQIHTIWLRHAYGKRPCIYYSKWIAWLIPI